MIAHAEDGYGGRQALPSGVVANAAHSRPVIPGSVVRCSTRVRGLAAESDDGRHVHRSEHSGG